MKHRLLFVFFLFLFPTLWVYAQSSPSSPSSNFGDVISEYPFQEAVQYLKKGNVIQGYADGNFKPDQTINRAEFLKIVMGAVGGDLKGGDCFSDVHSEWFAPSVCAAKSRGIISGYSDGTFQPDKNISFAEASKVLSMAFNLSTPQTSGEWYRPYVKALERKKAIPVSIDYFEKALSRGEMAEIVWRLKADPTVKASKTLASMSGEFPRIGSCDELEEKMKIENYRSNARYRTLYKDFEMSAPSLITPAESAESISSQTASDFSQTNVQVSGVDEADIVKNDGKYIYMIEGKNVRVLEAYPAENLQVVSVIRSDDEQFSPRSLYLSDGKLVVLGYTYSQYEASRKVSSVSIAPFYAGRVKVLMYDVADPSSPQLIRTSEFDGNLVTSRRIEEYIYVVMTVYPQGDDIIPLYSDSVTGVSGPVSTCTDIKFFPRYQSPQFLVVAGIPLDASSESKIEREVFMGAGAETVYSSLENMYVALQKNEYDEKVRYDVWEPPVFQTSTVFYQFKLDKGTIEYTSQGAVPGHLLNQFSMDEYGDTFRVATTTGDLFGGKENVSKNHLFILDRNNVENVLGKIEDIAPGEKIYSVRFMGKRAYMVTFKKVDPFFVIDVSDPASPAILGALKIPGYSDYLHPYDENHIIGFGKEAVAPTGEELQFGRDFAWYQGMKIAVFDVTDVSKPVEMFKEAIGDRGTESPLLHDHKALLFNASKELLAFPLSVAEIPGEVEGQYTGSTYGEIVFSGAYVYNLNLVDGFTLRGKVTHLDPSASQEESSYFWNDSSRTIFRILYIGDYLYTVSPAMVKVSNITDVQEVKSVEWEVEQPFYGIIE